MKYKRQQKGFKLRDGDYLSTIHYEVELKNGNKVTMLLDGDSFEDWYEIVEILSKNNLHITTYSQVDVLVELGD